MQVHYDEGVATHIGPESCGGIREDVVEALTGERIGQPLSRDAFTAADVYVGSMIGFGLRFGVIDKRPEFEAFWSGLENRPARLRAGAQVEKLASKHAWEPA